MTLQWHNLPANKKINSDMSRITNWLRANRISLNVAKTEIIIFSQSKQP